MFLLRSDDLPNELNAVMSSHELARGETLYRQGEPVQAVCALEHGRLLLYTCTSEGKQVPLYTVRSGECVAEAALFAQSYCSNAVAEVQSLVRSFPIKPLQDALRTRPDLAAEFMSLQAKRCQILRVTLELRALRSARQRILQFIETFAPPGSKRITLDRTLRNIADDLGLAPEVFYRTLSQLIEEGLVERTKTTIALAVRARWTESALQSRTAAR